MLTRREIVRLVEEECQLIISRAQMPQSDRTRCGLDNLRWYLRLSRNWAVAALSELALQSPSGHLLEVGAGYGMVSGAACRMGWRASAVDFEPIPNFSGPAAPERESCLGLCNICVDPLPFDTGSFEAVLFLEVLEHLPYSPAKAFMEMRRVLKPGGRLYLTTPHVDSLSRIASLIAGRNHEPFIELFLLPDDLSSYKGLTFFKSGREHRLWTASELSTYLPKWGFRVVDHYYYSTTFYDPDYPSVANRLRATFNSVSRPLVRRSRVFGGGGMIFVAEPT